MISSQPVSAYTSTVRRAAMLGTALLACLLFCESVIGQTQGRSDGDNDRDRDRNTGETQTLANAFDLDFTGAWGGWNFQLAEFADQNALLQGGFGGIEFNKELFVGWGLYKLQDAVSIDAGTDGTVDLRNIDFRYHGPILSYTPRARSVVHPRLGLMAGFGKIDIAGESATDRVTVIQPSAGMEINVTRWCRIGAEAGYRFGLGTESARPDVLAVGDGFATGFYGAATLRFGFSWGG